MAAVILGLEAKTKNRLISIAPLGFYPHVLNKRRRLFK